jgi:hypothetical protein
MEILSFIIDKESLASQIESKKVLKKVKNQAKKIGENNKKKIISNLDWYK